MAILRDDNFTPETSNGLAHIYNPQQTVFYSPKVATTNGFAKGPLGNPGLGSDEILRDVWGMPYIITLDMNYDDHCYDDALQNMYEKNHPGQTLLTSGKAVVWSFGPTRIINRGVGLGVSSNKYVVISSQ